MKKAKYYAGEIIAAISNTKSTNNTKILSSKLAEVFIELTVNELEELRIARNIKTDDGILAVFKEQRKKYLAICKRVNKVSKITLPVSDFDDLIKAIYPTIYNWYEKNIININYAMTDKQILEQDFYDFCGSSAVFMTDQDKIDWWRNNDVVGSNICKSCGLDLDKEECINCQKGFG